MTNVSSIVKSARKIMRQDTGTASDELRILQLGWMLFLKVFSDKDKELELLIDGYTSPIPPELHWDEWAGNDEGLTGDKLIKFVDQKLFPALKEIDLSTGNKRAVLVREVFDNNYNYMKSGIHLRQVINKLNEIDFNNSKDKQVFGQIYESFLGELQSAGTLGEFYTPRAITDLMTEMVDPKHGEKVLDPACGTGGFLTAVIEHLKTGAGTVVERDSIGKNVAGWEYKPLPYVLANTNLILHDVTTPNIRYGDSLEGASNIHFAKEAFEFIKGTEGCHILCLDITGFFDNLDTDILKTNWCRVWSAGTSDRLPDDHYNVFWSLKNFHYVEEKDIISVFGKWPRKRSKVDKNDKVALKRELNRSLHERICDFLQLKKAKNEYAGAKDLIRYKETLKDKNGKPLTGIPQGTAISGLLSNIFMIDFDLTVKSAVEKNSGCYRRYSDDIFIAFPVSISFEVMNDLVEKTLKKISNDSLVINPKKTEKRAYEAENGKQGTCCAENRNPAKIQYLGFTFDGEKTHIRSSSMSKNRSKISHTIRKNKKRKNKQTGLSNINTREVYKAQSPRKITPHNKIEDKGFVSYAARAGDIHNSETIEKQVRKNDRFIKNKIAEERKKKPKSKANTKNRPSE